MGDSLPHPSLGDLVPTVEALQISLVGLPAGRVGAGKTRLLRRCQLQLDLGGHAPRQISLQSQDVANVALVAAGPNVRLIRDVNELSSDAHDVTFPADGVL